MPGRGTLRRGAEKVGEAQAFCGQRVYVGGARESSRSGAAEGCPTDVVGYDNQEVWLLPRIRGRAGEKSRQKDHGADGENSEVAAFRTIAGKARFRPSARASRERPPPPALRWERGRCLDRFSSFHVSVVFFPR